MKQMLAFAGILSLHFVTGLLAVEPVPTVPPAPQPAAESSPAPAPVEATGTPPPATPGAAAEESALVQEAAGTVTDPEPTPVEFNPDLPILNPEPALPEPVVEEQPWESTPPVVVATQPHGSFHYLFQAGIGGYYDSNVNATPDNESEDFAITLKAGVALGWGNFKPEAQNLSSFNIFNRGASNLFNLANARNFYDRSQADNFLYLSYSPEYTYFIDGSADDDLDHNAAVEGRAAFGKFTLDLQLRFQALSDIETDIGSRTRRYLYKASLNSNYQLTGKTSIDLDLDYHISDYESLTDSQLFEASLWLNSQALEKVTAGIGISGGNLSVDDRGDQAFETISVRAAWQPTGKITIRGKIGVDLRQLDSGDRATPIYLASALYKPFDGTWLELDLSRSVNASASLSGENYISTGVSAKVRQRFLGKYYFNARLGYIVSDYYATDADRSTEREDNFYFTRASLEYQATQYWAVELYYQYRSDESNREEFDFSSHQIGVQAIVTF